MRTSAVAARVAKPYAELVSHRFEPAELKDLIVQTLDDAKAEDIVTIDVKAKSSLGDYMIIAGGRVNRHVGAIAERVVDALKQAKYGTIRVEGLPDCNWVLIVAGSVIVHVLQPEARDFYKLEKLWAGERPVDPGMDLTVVYDQSERTRPVS